MPCDRQVQRGQSLSDRKKQLKAKAAEISAALAKGGVKVKIGPQGAIAFDLGTIDRAGMTDACIYRRIMVEGTALAKAAIVKAEMLSGRKVSTVAVGQGIHSHDGGNTWHGKG